MPHTASLKKELQPFHSPRLGEIRYDPDKIIFFPEGIVGFSTFKRYLLLPHDEKGSPFFWFQCLEEPAFSFPITDPRLFAPSYSFQTEAKDLVLLDLKNEKQARVLAVVTIPRENPRELWLNLQGPIIINEDNCRAKQIILVGPDYPLRYKVSF